MRYIALEHLRSLEILPLREARPATPEAIALGSYKPVLIAEVSGTPRVLTGGGTIDAAAKAGVPELLARELPPMNAVEAAEAAAVAEERPGSYEPGELVALLDWLDDAGTSPSNRLRELLDGGKRGLLARAERIRALPELPRGVVLSGSLSLRHGELLADLPEELREAVGRRLGEGSFSLRRELVTMVYEVYRRREEEPEIADRLRELLEEADWREQLRGVRYPSLHGAEKALERFKSRWIRGTGLLLEEPENFEGDRFRLVIPFRSADELQTRLGEADKMVAEIDTITELLG